MGLGRVVFVVVTLMRSMTMAVVKIVDVVVVLDRGVAAVGTVFVFMLLGLEVSPVRDPAVQGVVRRRGQEERDRHQDDGSAGGCVDVVRRRHPTHGAEGPEGYGDADR